MAFHRAIYQLDGIKHFCEPFALPHYFGPDKRSIQFADEPEVAERFGTIPKAMLVLQSRAMGHARFTIPFFKTSTLISSTPRDLVFFKPEIILEISLALTNLNVNKRFSMKKKLNMYLIKS